jgi:hypothetical protein
VSGHVLQCIRHALAYMHALYIRYHCVRDIQQEMHFAFGNASCNGTVCDS